jgi:anti-anti-sigma regulatory factor
MGLLTSFKKEMDQRGGMLRLCSLDPARKGYFQRDRFAEQFEFFSDLESAMSE